MRAELITIGDELLIGQTINTNSAWLGEQLGLIGVRTMRCTTVSDSREEILTILHETEKRCDLILITGGLGPTKDDITKKTLCEYFGSKLVMNQKILKELTTWFEGRGLQMLEVNRQQAALPDNCIVIPNEVGTASGMWFEKDNKVFISMPGVPFEMEKMMAEILLDKIRKHFNTPSIVHRTILFQGIGESFLAEKISEWENSLAAENISLAYLPSPGQVKLRLSAYDGDENFLTEKVERRKSELLKLVSEFAFGFEKDTLQGVVGKLLADRNETISLAESCTGGFIGQLITSVPGSSAYFIGAVTTYHERVKNLFLGVPESVIAENGVVSEKVALAMADGARKKMNTTWALSTTGIAGPTGGTDVNPVGTIWIGLAGPNTLFARKFVYGRSRERNILMGANAALNMLRKEIQSGGLAS